MNPNADVSSFQGYQFWQATRDDILKTKEIDLLPSRWKPKVQSQIHAGKDDSGESHLGFHSRLQKEIFEDQELLKQIHESTQKLHSMNVTSESIDEAFEIKHSDSFSNMRRSSEKKVVSANEGHYGTGLPRIMTTGRPYIVSHESNKSYTRSGLALAVRKRDKRNKDFFKSNGESIAFSPRHYFLATPVITVRQWSANRTVLALVPKLEMSDLQLEFYQFWWDVVGRRFIFGLDPDLDGLVPLVSAQKIPVLKDFTELEFMVEILKNLRSLYKRREKGSIDRYRDHAKSLFDALGSV